MSNKTNDGGPAFPSGDGEYAGSPAHERGMSLRDYFAASVIGAIVTQFHSDLLKDGESVSFRPDHGNATGAIINAKHVAIEAYFIADAMIAARNGGAK